MAKKTEAVTGGIKGFFQKASASFTKGGTWLSTQTMWLGQKALYIGFVVASTSFITLMPLLFEIGREGQVRMDASEKGKMVPHCIALHCMVRSSQHK
jgi:hypothetical protein